MNYSSLTGLVGSSPIQNIGQVDSTPHHPPGLLMTAMDNWWGAGEFIYARANGVITQFALCVITPSFDSTLQSYRYDVTEVPNTANLGRPLAVAMGSMASGEYGWFQVAGITPIDCTASVAADTAFGIVAAGQGGAIANGKQVLNARVIVAAAATVVKTNCVAANASKRLQVPNAEGWFKGAFLSGTGIGAGTTVAAVSPDGREVTLSLDTTASVNGSVTATYNNGTVFYNVAHINRPFAQGQVA
jgi:hypothetical protein